jgi:hypothetical protein
MFFATKTEEGSRVRTQTFTTLHVVYNVFTLHYEYIYAYIYNVFTLHLWVYSALKMKN